MVTTELTKSPGHWGGHALRANACGSRHILRLLNLLILVALTGCGQAPRPSVPDLSAYTNIPPGMPVIITYRVQTKASMPKWVRDGLNSVTLNTILDSITPEQVVVHASPTDTNLFSLPKEAVNSIRIHPP